MRLRDRVEKANENIECLIDDLIGLKREEYRDYCVGYSKERGNCESMRCDGCKEIYFEEMREEMIKKYLV